MYRVTDNKVEEIEVFDPKKNVKAVGEVQVKKKGGCGCGCK